MQLHEFVIDYTNLPLDDYYYWSRNCEDLPCEIDEPCIILQELGSLVVALTEQMEDSFIYIRVPIGTA